MKVEENTKNQIVHVETSKSNAAQVETSNPSIEYLNNKIEDLNKKTEALEQLKKDIYELKQKVDQVNKQASEIMTNLLVIFGIFASILSFLTIEFGLLKKLTKPKEIAGFSCILFSLMLGFNLSLVSLAKTNNDKKLYITCIFWAIVAILLGIIGYGFLCDRLTGFPII